MALSSLIKRQLLHVLGNQIIPWLNESGDKRLVLFEPPLKVPSGMQLIRRPAPPLRVVSERSHRDLMNWPEMGLHTARFPYMGFVLDGEADLRTAFTDRMIRESRVKNGGECEILTIAAPGFFLIPPLTPHPDGSCPHCEKADVSKSSSRILWIMAMPAGAICHTCSSKGHEHYVHNGLFIRDPQLLALTQILQEELQLRALNFEAVARAQLLTLMLRIERDLASGQFLSAGNQLQSGQTSDSNANGMAPELPTALDRACKYIKDHLQDPLSPKLIAKNAYVSASQLNRLFRTHHGTTVMKYAADCRIETAKYLLEDTDLPMMEISSLTGFRYPSHFTKAFSRKVGIAPQEFRREKRKDHREKRHIHSKDPYVVGIF